MLAHDLIASPGLGLPACRRLLFPLLHAEKVPFPRATKEIGDVCTQATTGLTRLDIGQGGRVTIPSKKGWHGYLFSVSLEISNNAPESSSSMEFCRHPGGGRGFSKSDPYLKGMESYMYHSKPKRALEKVRLTYSLKDTVLFSWANWSGIMRLVWQPYANLVLFLYNYYDWHNQGS